MPKTKDELKAIYDAVSDSFSPVTEELIFNAIKAGVKEAVDNYLEEHGLQ